MITDYNDRSSVIRVIMMLFTPILPDIEVKEKERKKKRLLTHAISTHNIKKMYKKSKSINTKLLCDSRLRQIDPVQQMSDH